MKLCIICFSQKNIVILDGNSRGGARSRGSPLPRGVNSLSTSYEVLRPPFKTGKRDLDLECDLSFQDRMQTIPGVPIDILDCSQT